LRFSSGKAGKQEGGGVERTTASADDETITVHIPMPFVTLRRGSPDWFRMRVIGATLWSA
jgi:hypothetical protein